VCQHRGQPYLNRFMAVARQTDVAYLPAIIRIALGPCISLRAAIVALCHETGCESAILRTHLLAAVTIQCSRKLHAIPAFTFTVDYALIWPAWQAVAVNRVMRTVLQDPSSRVSVAFSTACFYVDDSQPSPPLGQRVESNASVSYTSGTIARTMG
jgi:hypothetical protein